MKRKKQSREEVLTSTIALAKLLVENRPKDTLEVHLKELLNVLIWKASQAEGKYTCRFVSEGFRKNPQETNIEHEHVLQRKKLIKEMLENPDQIDTKIRSVIGCVVLKKEHEKLTKVSKSHPHLDGWERYREAGIRVYDTAEEKYLW